ncbi:hypothetical protein B296_00005764 [Ensete ventricosum]|uniref:Uncharacterized protein n=1 Tax=Ensete ventricosum TaxID=4639 RepID=A0A426ZHM7_ENSVE|nr:hypothetical protein B296_00005764 [Ensete ventricosum]
MIPSHTIRVLRNLVKQQYPGVPPLGPTPREAYQIETCTQITATSHDPLPSYETRHGAVRSGTELGLSRKEKAFGKDDDDGGKDGAKRAIERRGKREKPQGFPMGASVIFYLRFLSHGTKKPMSLISPSESAFCIQEAGSVDDLEFIWIM